MTGKNLIINKCTKAKSGFLILIAFVMMIPLKSFSQDSLLTLQEAIGISLKKNFDIRISSNISEQARNNNTAGNAGMLPSLYADGSYSHSSNTLKQNYSTGLEVNRDAAVSTNLSGDLGATWTIFDGTRMFATKNKLSELSMQSLDQQKIQIENSIQEVITSYYSIAREQQLITALEEELKLSEERLKISERMFNNGSGSKLVMLVAQTEYNRQRAAMITLKSQAEAAKINLNRLLGRNIETPFTIEDTVIITYKPSFEDLKKTVSLQNNVLSYYRRNQRVAELELKETKALRLPVVDLNAHYIFSKSTNEAGFTLLNQLQGFNYGATATIPIFQGFNIGRQIKNSKLDVMNAGLSLESANLQITADLYNAWRIFSNNLELLQIEEQNILFAREILDISQERFRIGVSNTVELLEAQRTFENAMIRLADARFNAKISETDLRRLNGELVK